MTRLERVRNLIDEKFNGNQADFSRAIGKAPAQVNQWLNGYRNIGDAAALNIEKSLDLPQGYLDGEMNKTMERLYTAAKELHGIDKQAEIARMLNASSQTVKNWETRGISKQGLLDIQKIMGISPDWIETGEGSMRLTSAQNEIKDIHRPMLWSSNDPLPEDDYTFAPYMKEQAFCGGPGSFEIPDYNGFRLPFGRATLRRKSISPDNVFCCTLTGDSMEERIAEDAAIAVDAGEKTIRDGKIYAFRHGDLFRVKYLSRLPGGRVKIKSHNPAYEDEEAGLEDIEVIGRVFWWSVLD